MKAQKKLSKIQHEGQSSTLIRVLKNKKWKDEERNNIWWDNMYQFFQIDENISY